MIMICEGAWSLLEGGRRIGLYLLLSAVPAVTLERGSPEEVGQIEVVSAGAAVGLTEHNRQFFPCSV